MLLLVIAGCLPAASATVEDEAHRVDRLATERLNRQFLAQHPALPGFPASTIAKAEQPGPEQSLRDREAAAIARWRAAVTACRLKAKPDDC